MIVVTGGSGRLGAWVVAALLERGHQVACLSRRPSTEPRVAGLIWREKPRCIACDLGDPACLATLRRELAGATAVIHLAAHVPGRTTAGVEGADAAGGEGREVTGMEVEAWTTLQSNVLGTVRLLEALGDAAHLRTFVLASTAEVYGAPRSSPITEDHSTSPDTYHGASKLAAEKYVALFSGRQDVACSSLRMAALYGPGDTLLRPPGDLVVAAVRGRPLELHGDGDDRLDLLYVADAAEAFVAAVERSARGAVNLGSGAGFPVRQIVDAVRQAAGGDGRVVERERAGPLARPVLDISRARLTLGWIPRTALEEGIASQVAWARSALLG